MSRKLFALLMSVAVLSALATTGSAGAVKFRLVSTVAPSIRTCVQQAGASSVNPAGVGNLGGSARFAGVRQTFVWGWIDYHGSARLMLYVVEGTYGLQHVQGLSSSARNALTTCLRAYEPPRSYFGHCSFGPHGDYCRR